MIVYLFTVPHTHFGFHITIPSPKNSHITFIISLETTNTSRYGQISSRPYPSSPYSSHAGNGPMRDRQAVFGVLHVLFGSVVQVNSTRILWSRPIILSNTLTSGNQWIHWQFYFFPSLLLDLSCILSCIILYKPRKGFVFLDKKNSPDHGTPETQTST